MKYDLIKLDQIEYENCLKTMTQRLSKLGFVVSIYKFGLIKFPGISDMDLMIILDNEFEFERKRQAVINTIQFSKISSYIIYHNPIVITEDDYQFSGYFHSLENKSHVWGKDIIENRKIIFNKENVLVWNSYFYQKFLIFEAGDSTFSERRALLLINNLAYSVKNNDTLNGSSLYPDYRSRVDELRGKILNNVIVNAEKSIINLFSMGMDIIRAQEKNALINSTNLNTSYDMRERAVFIPSKELGYKKFFWFVDIYFST